jgi:hypothetical protein
MPLGALPTKNRPPPKSTGNQMWVAVGPIRLAIEGVIYGHAAEVLPQFLRPLPIVD